jgi:myo-inositol-1(or 4)-monophosphatase
VGAGASTSVLVSEGTGDGVSGEGSAAGGAAGSAPEELRELACALAREAGTLLLERFETGRAEEVRSKTTPTDLVSEADLASEALLRERLSQLRPDDGFLGEEGAGASGSSGLRWVVDPLDGTVNFLFGIPQWAVSVAVQELRVQASPAQRRAEGGSAAPASGAEPSSSMLLGGGVTIAGAIYDPPRQEMWSARIDGPALRDEAAIEGSRHTDLATAMLATGLAYDAKVRAEQAKVLAALIPRVRDIRRLGSAALDLAWTAAGRYDAYYERSVKLWDVAAGALICERAGVSVRELPPTGGLPAGLLACAPPLADELFASVTPSS